MRFILFVVLASTSACKDRAPTQWHGIPAGITTKCKHVADEVHVCIGGGKAYTCIRDEGANDTHRWVVFECARTSSPLLPEEPKED